MQFDGQHPWRSKLGSLMPKAWDALAVAHGAVVSMGNARDVRAIEVAWNQVRTHLDIVKNQAKKVVPDTGPVAGFQHFDSCLERVEASRTRTARSRPSDYAERSFEGIYDRR